MCSQCFKEQYCQTYEADKLGVIILITERLRYRDSYSGESSDTGGVQNLAGDLSLPGFPLEQLMAAKYNRASPETGVLSLRLPADWQVASSR